MKINSITKGVLGLLLISIASRGAPCDFATAAIITKTSAMDTTMPPINDSILLSRINARFIKNFLTQDVKSHDEIIHKDFVCIESNGTIISRDTYLKNWATDFDNSGYNTFTYADEHIRIFGNIALVRSKTIYTRITDGKKEEGYTIYTDTYLKEHGHWKCIQVQITPVLRSI